MPEAPAKSVLPKPIPAQPLPTPQPGPAPTPNPELKTTKITDIPLVKLLTKQATVTKTTDKDTLIDIHVGNPLKRIMELLEDIKKQKAFTFTLKGSFGLMGVVLVLSMVGIFGSNKILCNKGTQTLSGTLRVLSIVEPATPPTLIGRIKRLFGNTQDLTGLYRVILLTNQGVVHLIPPSQALAHNFENLPVLTTGSYNACTMEIKVTDEKGMERC